MTHAAYSADTLRFSVVLPFLEVFIDECERPKL